MQTISLPAQATVMQKRTDPLSASTNLAVGCLTHRHGLTLKPGLEYESWMAVGKRLSELTGAAMWMIGDWFAYGHDNYTTSKWGGRVPDGLYAQKSAETGYTEQTLRNAKYVCSALPLSRRRDKLTFSHALEIVSRVSDEEDREKWIERVEQEGMSTKVLRERLRKASSKHKEEPNDTGELSFLEVNRQFNRDYLSGRPKVLSPALKAELLKIHEQFLKDLLS